MGPLRGVGSDIGTPDGVTPRRYPGVPSRSDPPTSGRRDGATRPGSMDVKRYFRGPFFWVALVIIGVLLVTSISSATGGFKKVDTSVAIKAIETGQVEKAKVVDRDQRLELTLTNSRVPGADGATKIQTDYVDARQREIINLLDANKPSG